LNNSHVRVLDLTSHMSLVSLDVLLIIILYLFLVLVHVIVFSCVHTCTCKRGELSLARLRYDWMTPCPSVLCPVCALVRCRISTPQFWPNVVKMRLKQGSFCLAVFFVVCFF